MKSKLLVIGSDGFIGKNLVNFFSNRGYDVTGKGYHDVVSRYDYIINCAGKIHSDLTSLINSNIFYAHHYVSKYLELNPLCKYLHLGSSSEYGRMTNPAKESDLCVPETGYAKTKLSGTMLVQEFVKEKNYNVNVNIIRPFSVYGKHDLSTKFIPTLLKSIQYEKDIKLFFGSHDWIYIEDFCTLCELILLSDCSGEIFNAGTGVSLTNEQVLRIVESLVSKHAKINRQSDLYRSYDTSFWAADMSKVKKIFNWTPTYNIESGLHDLITR